MLLEQVGTVTVATPQQNTFASMVTDTEILVVQLGLNVTKEIIDAAPKLTTIATATTGLDHIDTAYAHSKGITIVSLKDETEFLQTVTSTAELALGLMVALIKKIPAAHTSVLQGNWHREEFRGHSLRRKVLGIIGYGRLGKLMAQYSSALDMQVIYTDPHVSGGVPLDEVLQMADIISLHIHLTPDTEGSIGANELAAMKKGALLINTARGKIVNEAALIHSLETGAIGGYATDVLYDELEFEGSTAKSPLIEYAKTHSNVIITPHIGGTTVESREATDIFIAQKLAEHL